MSFSIKRLAGIAVVATGLSVSTYAFTATNTVEGSQAGSGDGVISGYAVTGVDYVLNGTDPTKIDAVSFDLDGASSTVKVRFGASATWFACVVDVNDAATCDTSGAGQPSVTETSLTVVAAD